MPSRRKPPIGARLRQSAVGPIALGMALGVALASDPPRSFGELTGPLRPGPGRLVGIPYAPEGASLSGAQRRALWAENIRLSPGVGVDEERQSPEILRRRAILALTKGNPDDAVQLLERALERLPANSVPSQEAILRSDLSAAHLQRFAQGDSPISSFQALDEAARVAYRGFSGVRFNHAQALEGLYLGRQAKEVWRGLSGSSLEPGWAAEAARHVGAIDRAQVGSQADIDRLLARIGQGDRRAAQELVQKEPQRARELATRDAPWDWAEAVGRGEAAAAKRQLATIELLAAPLADHGDRVALDTITQLRAASPDQLQVAARGLRAYKEGFRLYRRFDHEEGIATLEAARRDLAATRLPLELEAELYQSYLENNAGRPGSRERVASVAARSAGRSYPGVEALTSWFEALIAGREGRPYDQAEAYRRTRAIYASLGEVENQSSVEGLLGEAFGGLGRRQDELRSYLSAAAVVSRVRDPYRRRIVWTLFASSSREMGLRYAVLPIQEEMLDAASEQEDPTAVSEPLLLRASLRAEVGDRTGAETDLAAVQRLVSQESDLEDRERIQADLARVGAEFRSIATQGTDLDKAIELYSRTGQGIFEMTVRASRARLRVEDGDLRGAEEDLNAVVAFANRGGESWLADASDEERYSFGREVRTAFTGMIRFLASRPHRASDAFGYQEAARELLAPKPLPHFEFSSVKPLPGTFSLAKIANTLPPDVALIQFALLNDRVISWLITKEGSASFETLIAREEVGKLVNRLGPEGGLAAKDWQGASARLFDLLLRPLNARVLSKKTWVIVPEGALSRLPWSGLWDRQRDRYLIEDREIVVNPSASAYLQALARRIELEREVGSSIRALVVGDPAFDTEEWKTFRRLPGALREAGEVGRIYGESATVLLGKAATWSDFKTAAPTATLLHLGMHATLNSTDPFRSLLLFADPGPLGGRSLRDLASLRLGRTRLAFLAACESSGQSEGSEGFQGVARAFLAAGVPAVVGSLWNVDDQKGFDFSVDFARSWRSEGSASAALREASVRSIEREGRHRRNRPVGTWVSFQVLGAG